MQKIAPETRASSSKIKGSPMISPTAPQTHLFSAKGGKRQPNSASSSKIGGIKGWGLENQLLSPVLLRGQLRRSVRQGKARDISLRGVTDGLNGHFCNRGDT